MKQFFTLFAFLFSFIFQSQSHAQCVIPNASFENWENVEQVLKPALWSTSNVERTSDAQSGQFAILLKIISQQGLRIPSFAVAQFDCNSRPGYLVGYIKTRLNQDDTLIASLALYASETEAVGGGGGINVVRRNTYTQFHIPINYFSQQSPTKAIITFQVNQVGAEVKIDNLSFSNTPLGVDLSDDEPNAVAKKILSSAQLKLNIFPVPASNSASFKLESAMTSVGNLRLLNLLGTEVRSLGTMQITPGQSTHEVNIAGLKPGIYFLQLTTPAGQVNQRLIIK
jgi:hypothetical protein